MNILIIRLSAIGDVVMALPLADTLRARYPDARIAWLVQPEAAGLVAASPAVDEVITWPRGAWAELRRQRRWAALAGEVRTFVRDLRARRFDRALDAQGLLKSGIWAWLSRAPVRIGVGSREGRDRLMTRVLAVPRDDPQVASEYRALARSVGAEPQEWRLHLALDAADRAPAARSITKFDPRQVAQQLVFQLPDDPGDAGLRPGGLQAVDDRDHMRAVAEGRQSQQAQIAGRGLRKGVIGRVFRRHRSSPCAGRFSFAGLSATACGQNGHGAVPRMDSACLPVDP